MVYREIALFLTYDFPTHAIQAIQHDGPCQESHHHHEHFDNTKFMRDKG
jgi:hypothetical protein